MNETTNNDITNQITIIRTKLNLAKGPEERQELTKQLNVLSLKKQIEDIKKRIQQLSQN